MNKEINYFLLQIRAHLINLEQTVNQQDNVIASLNKKIKELETKKNNFKEKTVK